MSINNFDIVHKKEQVVYLTLAREMAFEGKFNWHFHSGRFGGAIQAFVLAHMIDKYVKVLEHIYGKHAEGSMVIEM